MSTGNQTRTTNDLLLNRKRRRQNSTTSSGKGKRRNKNTALGVSACAARWVPNGAGRGGGREWNLRNQRSAALSNSEDEQEKAERGGSGLDSDGVGDV